MLLIENGKLEGKGSSGTASLAAAILEPYLIRLWITHFPFIYPGKLGKIPDFIVLDAFEELAGSGVSKNPKAIIVTLPSKLDKRQGLNRHLCLSSNSRCPVMVCRSPIITSFSCSLSGQQIAQILSQEYCRNGDLALAIDSFLALSSLDVAMKNSKHELKDGAADGRGHRTAKRKIRKDIVTRVAPVRRFCGAN